MDENIEYIQLFMEYESDDMPVVYFYEVSLMNDRSEYQDYAVSACASASAISFSCLTSDLS